MMFLRLASVPKSSHRGFPSTYVCLHIHNKTSAHICIYIYIHTYVHTCIYRSLASNKGFAATHCWQTVEKLKQDVQYSLHGCPGILLAGFNVPTLAAGRGRPLASKCIQKTTLLFYRGPRCLICSAQLNASVQRIDGWMHGWMDGWMDGWTDR